MSNITDVKTFLMREGAFDIIDRERDMRMHLADRFVQEVDTLEERITPQWRVQGQRAFVRIAPILVEIAAEKVSLIAKAFFGESINAILESGKTATQMAIASNDPRLAHYIFMKKPDLKHLSGIEMENLSRLIARFEHSKPQPPSSPPYSAMKRQRSEQLSQERFGE